MSGAAGLPTAGPVELMLMMITCAVHVQTHGYQQYSLFQGCDGSTGNMSFIFNEDPIAHFDYTVDRCFVTLPNFIVPVNISDFTETAVNGLGYCKQGLEILNDFYVNTTEALEPPWTSIYPKREVKLSVENALVCHVSSFFPPPVRVSWSRNQLNVTEGVTLGQYIQNDDGTLSMFSSLSFIPQQGDQYSCTVEHRALEHPQTRTWDVEVDRSSVSPMVVCAVGWTTGFVGFSIAAFFISKANNINR